MLKTSIHYWTNDATFTNTEEWRRLRASSRQDGEGFLESLKSLSATYASIEANQPITSETIAKVYGGVKRDAYSTQVITFKVAVFGSPKSGKSSLIHYLCGASVSKEYEPTLGIQVYETCWPIQVQATNTIWNVKIEFWDCGCTAVASNDFLLASMCEKADGIVFVSSMADSGSLSFLLHAVEQLEVDRVASAMAITSTHDSKLTSPSSVIEASEGATISSMALSAPAQDPRLPLPSSSRSSSSSSLSSASSSSASFSSTIRAPCTTSLSASLASSTGTDRYEPLVHPNPHVFSLSPHIEAVASAFKMIVASKADLCSREVGSAELTLLAVKLQGLTTSPLESAGRMQLSSMSVATVKFSAVVEPNPLSDQSLARSPALGNEAHLMNSLALGLLKRYLGRE